jgi:hypothetical protein
LDVLAANQPAALRQVILTYQDAMILPAGNESTGDFPPPKPEPERQEYSIAIARPGSASRSSRAEPPAGSSGGAAA